MQEKWLKTSLADLVDVIGGGTPKTGVLEYWDGNIPWLSIADFKSETRWVSDTEKYITDLGLKNSSTRLLDKGDLIISARGTVGAVAQLSRPMAFNQSCYGLKTKESCYSDFLYYLLQFNFHNIASSAYGAVFDTITRETFNNIFVTVPPLPKQKKIAAILSTWDEAIEKLNSYIEAKKKLKKALMQRLLTGKQRFKEFIVRDGYKKTELGWIPEDWEPLGSVFDIFAGGDVPKDVFSEVETEELKVPIFSNGVGEKSLYGWTDKPKINKPSLTVSARGTIGWTSYRDQPFVPVVRLLVLTPKIEMNLKYAYYFMKTIESNYKVSPAGIPQLTKPMIESVKIPLPPLPEQKKIAEILSKADEEIDLLNQELEKLKTQKKGLMQKLLTGAWRVKL